MIRFEKSMLKLNYKRTAKHCLSMVFSCFRQWVSLGLFQFQKLSEVVRNYIGGEYKVKLVLLAPRSTQQPPPPALSSTLPPPAVDSVSEKKSSFIDIYSSLMHIFLSRPVSTAGPKDSIGAWGIKGGGL